MTTVVATAVTTYFFGLVAWFMVHASTGWQGGWRKCVASSLSWPWDAYHLVRQYR